MSVIRPGDDGADTKKGNAVNGLSSGNGFDDHFGRETYLIAEWVLRHSH
jgi:hypothetical protein